jgi:two-component system sensor histidine kinase BaeS
MFMYVVNMWSFQNGFLDYVNRNELNQLDGLSIALQKEFARENSWVSFQKQPLLWRQLINNHVLNPARLRESTLLRSQRDPHKKERRPKRPGRLLLLDESQGLIIGRQALKERAIFRPLMHNNRIIGYLGIEKRVQLSENLDQIFSKQQQQNFIWIALGSVLITVLIALPFASQIIKPIQALLDGTRSLASGNYQSRVEVKTRDETGKLAKAFNQMAENIEKNRDIQKQWLADISHELRTPLSVIKGEIEAMLDGIRPLQKENIKSLHQEINYINRLVNDLHELSQSDLSVLQPKKSKLILSNILNEVLEIFKNEIEEKQLNISINCLESLPLFADKDQLLQVFINLLQNNLRYSENKANIFITVESKNNNGENTIHLRWEDSGPGVKNENLTKLFDRLYREDSSRSLFKGSGLGLSISKNIIQVHKGSISAFHSKQGGLGIEIILPASS